MNEFVASLSEIFAQFGEIQARPMFGGYGLFHDGLMFALVADDVVYLKADSASSPVFVDRDLPQFEYEKSGKRMKMSYFMAPEEIFDDTGLAREWACRAFDAALRARKPRQKP